MMRVDTEVIVIGGGATGAGVFRDLSVRGIQALLIEQEDLANGTSSRFHGLLHSGGRYAVEDKEAALECYRENLIIQKTIPGSVENTGGLFVKLSQDEDKYVEEWLNAMQKLEIPVDEISIESALKNEPYINRNTQVIYKVPDATINGFTMIVDLVKDGVKRGGQVLTYHQVIDVIISRNQVSGVKARNLYTNEVIEVFSNIVINASGPWADKVAALAGIHFDLINNKGILAVFNHRFNNSVINRLRKPSDGDIFVPSHNVTIFGTTGVNIEEIDNIVMNKRELIDMLKKGKELIPEIDNIRLIRAYVGVRPLFKEKGLVDKSGRNLSRELALLDHSTRDGLSNFITITGGKFTTFRYMAEKTVDLVCRKLGLSISCTTHEEIIPDRKAVGSFTNAKTTPAARIKLVHWVGEKANNIEKKLKQDDILNTVVCECEQVTLVEIESVITDRFNLNDIRRRTRIGMGTCQGTYCLYRTAVLAAERGIASTNEVEHALKDALKERQKGMRVTAFGETAKQLEMMNAIYYVSLGYERKVIE